MTVIGPETQNRVYAPMVVGFCLGILGACLMTFLFEMAGVFGLSEFSVEELWGAYFVDEESEALWLIGFGVHVALGAVAGALYGLGIRTIGKDGFVLGMVLGIVHWLVAGVGINFLPIEEEEEALGMFLMSDSLGSGAAFFIAHLAFGILLGTALKRHRMTTKDY